jgi:hypothetical protein
MKYVILLILVMLNSCSFRTKLKAQKMNNDNKLSSELEINKDFVDKINVPIKSEAVIIIDFSFLQYTQMFAEYSNRTFTIEANEYFKVMFEKLVRKEFKQVYIKYVDKDTPLKNGIILRPFLKIDNVYQNESGAAFDYRFHLDIQPQVTNKQYELISLNPITGYVGGGNMTTHFLMGLTLCLICPVAIPLTTFTLGSELENQLRVSVDNSIIAFHNLNALFFKDLEILSKSKNRDSSEKISNFLSDENEAKYNTHSSNLSDAINFIRTKHIQNLRTSAVVAESARQFNNSMSQQYQQQYQQIDSFTPALINVPTYNCGIKPIPKINHVIGDCVNGKWEQISDFPTMSCGIKPIPKINHVIGDCVNGKWEQISIGGTESLNCGLKPIPQMGCHIGECRNGEWKEICN